MLDIQSTLDIQPILENRPTSNVTLLVLRIWKKPPLILGPEKTQTNNHSL